MTTQASQDLTRMLYYGDNLEVLRNRQWFPDDCVDLVYLDPPFKSQQDYNVLFKSQKGTPAAAQVQAFSDTWKWDTAAKAAYEQLVSDPLVPGQVGQMIEAFYKFLDGSEMMAYLVMMTPRLLELHRVLKSTGSLYLHCDPAASHYLKLVLDTIFGPGNFRNEIVWKRSSAHSDVGQGAKHMGRLHDIIFNYSKGDSYTSNRLFTPYDPSYLENFYRHVEAGTGRRYMLGDLTGPRGAAKGNPRYEFMGVTRYWRYTKERVQELLEQGRIVQSKPGAVPRYKRYLDEMPGVPLQDIWDDILPIGAQAKERLGYPTQKPLALLRRIIQASSNPGDLVLDPFCGCGTAVVAAEELGRSWIGIDVTYLAMDVMARRLRDHFPKIQFEVRGQPRDAEGALALAQKDRYEFQFWALSLVGGQAVVPDRRGPDRGIDGYLLYQAGGELERAIVSVKSGGVGVRDVRDLHGTMQREKAEYGLLITLEQPTAPMRKEAVDAGQYQMPGIGASIPRIEILTVEELLLSGRRPAVAPYSPGPVAQAPRLRRRRGTQLALGAQESPEP
ncbi:MAG: DNA methyltransferase [Dehalococcoidia bacterium]|nr:DNA methyltransferase [Dehalococcoidia bacterium]